MHVEDHVAHWADCFDDARAHGEVRHEVAVHDVDVGDFSAGGFGVLQLLTEKREVGGQQ